MIEYRTVIASHDDLLRQAACLHVASLSYRSFITLFGEKFIHQLYIALLDDRRAFLVCALEQGRLLGFILASIDGEKIFSVAFKRWFIFGRIMLPAIARKPSLFIKTLQTLQYSNKSGVDVPAELVVIAVHNEWRSLGIGTHLVETLDNVFRMLGVKAYKTTVHREMTLSNSFYVKNGLNLYGSFFLYDVAWNVYVKTL